MRVRVQADIKLLIFHVNIKGIAKCSTANTRTVQQMEGMISVRSAPGAVHDQPGAPHSSMQKVATRKLPIRVDRHWPGHHPCIRQGVLKGGRVDWEGGGGGDENSPLPLLVPTSQWSQPSNCLESPAHSATIPAGSLFMIPGLTTSSVAPAANRLPKPSASPSSRHCVSWSESGRMAIPDRGAATQPTNPQPSVSQLGESGENGHTEPGAATQPATRNPQPHRRQ